MEERLDQFVDQLVDRMNDMMNSRRRGDRNGRRSEGEESENSFFKGDSSSSDEQPDRPRRNQREDSMLEEVFEFKEILKNKMDSLIATKLRGRAFVWWQQLKLTRERVEKPGGTKSVEDYTTKFYELIARNDIQETDDQLVSRYIGGLRVRIMDYVNMFDLMTLSDAYQRALAFEKQNQWVRSLSSPALTEGSFGSGNVASRFVPNQARPGGGNIKPSECKKAGKRTLFAKTEEWEDNGVANDDYEEDLVFYDDQYKEEIVSGDVGVNLMV
nr:hypothetical protein [Tanacetum cinerariifolium]